jgi:glycosyltransferase involved in cell wall biosynthesis
MPETAKKTVAMLLTNSFLPHQGRFQRVFNEAKSLVDAGWRVVILAWDRTATCPGREEMDGIEIVRFGIRSREKAGPVILLSMLRYMWSAFRWVIKNDVAVVHCHNLDVTLLGWVLGKLKNGVRVIYDFCEPDYYTYWDRKWTSLFLLIGEMEKALVRRCDCLLVHNHYQMDKYRALGVENIVHIGSYPFREMILPEVRRKKRGGIGGDAGSKVGGNAGSDAGNNAGSDAGNNAGSDTVIGRIGTIYEKNGVEEIVAAFRLLAPRHPRLRLLLAGRVLDVYRPAFDALIDPIRDRVELIGAFNSSDMPMLYEKIDISLMMYVLDDWFRNITPTKFFDSLACGVPVVISDMGRIRELMGGRPCGVVVESPTPEALAGAIEDMIAAPETRLEMAKNGLTLIRERCNWGLMEKRLLAVYSSVSATGS